MRIDVRGLKHPEPMKKIRETVKSMCTEHVDVEVLIDSCEYGKMITDFAKMSGCKTEVVKEGEVCLVKITGNMCKCSLTSKC